jgi:hypothetical protein
MTFIASVSLHAVSARANNVFTAVAHDLILMNGNNSEWRLRFAIAHSSTIARHWHKYLCFPVEQAVLHLVVVDMSSDNRKMFEWKSDALGTLIDYHSTRSFIESFILGKLEAKPWPICEGSTARSEL